MKNLESGGVGATTLSAPRKVLAVFLSFVLAFGLSPFAKVNRAHAEEVKAASFTTQEKVTDASNAEASVTSGETTEYYDTLASAISAAKENDTVTLLKDVTLEGEGTEDNPVLSIDKAITLTSEDKAITLKTTTTGNLGVGVKVSASATFKGVKFYRSGDSATQSGNKTFYAMLVTSGSYDVTLDGATIDLKYDGTDNAYRTGLYSRTNGKLTIKGQSYINAKYAINIAGTNGTASLEASTASAGWSVLSFRGVNNKVTVDHCKLTSGNALNGVSNLYAAIWFRGYQGQGVGNSVTVTNTELSVAAKGGNGADQAITGAYGDASLYESEEAFKAATNHVTLGEGNAVTLSSEGSSGAKAIFEYSDIDLKITGGTFNADPRTGAFEYGAYGNNGKQAWSKDTEGSGRNGSKNYVAEGYKVTEADGSYKVEAKSDVDVAQEYQKAFEAEYTKDNANHVTWDTLFDAMLTYGKVKGGSDDAVTALKSYYEGIKSISLANENIAESSYGKSATYEGRDAGSLEYLVNLETIDLSNTNIADKESMLALGVFADVEGEGESAKVTAHFKNLKSLDVSGNADVADFGGLQACTSLESLNLSGTGATNMGAFLGFKSLKSLDISKTAMKDFNGFYDSATVQFPALTSLTATGLTIDSITGLVEVANHSGIPANAKWDLSGSTMTEDYGNHVTQLKNAFSGISGGEFKAPIVKVSEPVVKTGLVYNGKVQRGLDYAKGYELSGFVGYDFTAGGNLDGQNAGTYTVTATLQEGYTWLDGSTEAKTFTYTIAEAAVSSTLHSDATAAASAFKTEHYNTHTNGQTFEADEKYYVKAVDGSYADSLESVTIGGTEHKATDTFKLSSGNNATVTFNYFKVKDGDLYVAFPVALFDMLESGTIKVGEVEISYSGTDDGKATVSAVEPHLASNSALTVTSDGSNAYTVTQSALKPSDEYIEIKIDELVNLADKALMITKKVYKNASGVESTSYGFTDSEKARLGNVLGFYVFPYSKTIAPLASDGCSYTSYQAYLLDVGKTASMSFAMKVSSDRFGVTFDSDGGSEVATQKLAYGEKATGPETPKKDGYTFAGWQLGDADYDFSEAVTSDIALTAKWEKEKVPEAVKTLYADAQSAAEAYKTAHYNKYSKDQKIPAGEDLYVKATTDASLPDDLASITVGDQEYKSNATFEMSIGMDAYITGCKYFQVKDGDLYIAIPVVLFEMIDGAKVKADSLELAYDGGKNEAVAVKSVAGEKDEGSVLEARTDDTENSYTVYHDASKPATEGVEIELDGLSDNQVMITKKTLLKNEDGSQYSANYGFTAPDPSARSGVDRALRFYAFGWNAEKVGSAWSNYHYTYQAYLMGSGKTAALTLNMKVADRYEVSFASEGGSEVAAQQVWSGEKAKKPASDPTKEGYSFIDWYAKGSESAYNFETTVTANITLTAKWEPKTYDVKVAEGITGGTVTTNPADKAAYESDVTVTATPDESHYVGKVTYQVGDAEAVEVAKGENGAYSFKMPAGNVTVSAEFTDKAPQVITAPETLDVVVGDSSDLNATVDSGEKLTYESSNASVAIVDEFGKVSGVKAGTATITVKAAGTEKFLAGENTVTVTVRDAVAKIGDKSYATLADAVKSAKGGETVELVADSIETEALAFPAGVAVTVDLKGKKITLPALAVQVTDEANATIKSTGDAKGEIYAESFATGSNSLFNVLTNSSVSLENIKLVTNGTALYPQGDAAKVSVKNCDITAGVYAVGTNSATTDNYNVVIDLQDSTLSATGFNGADGDDAPLMINVAGTMNVKNCTVSGHRIGVLARAGKVTIADSKIIYSGDGNEVANFDDSQTWRDGNNVYGAAITVGNYGTAAATAYKANADVTLENATIENASTRPSIAVFDNPGYSATVKVSGEKTKIQGALVSKTQNEGSSLSVEAGQFSDKSVKSFVADGYTTKDVADVPGTFQVVREYTITVAPIENGRITVTKNDESGDVTKAVMGDKIVIADADNTGDGTWTDYLLTSVEYKVDGSNTPTSVNKNSNDVYQFDMPAGNVTIGATFDWKPAGPTIKLVKDGTLDKVIKGGNASNQFNILAETADPSWEYVSSNPEVATIDKKGNVQLIKDGQTTISAAAAATQSTRSSETQVTLNVKYQVAVSTVDNGTYTVLDKDGKEIKGEDSGANAGDAVTVTNFYPASGYRFNGLTVRTGSSVVDTTLSEDGKSYTFTMPNAPVSIEPDFAAIVDISDAVITPKWDGDTYADNKTFAQNVQGIMLNGNAIDFAADKSEFDVSIEKTVEGGESEKIEKTNESGDFIIESAGNYVLTVKANDKANAKYTGTAKVEFELKKADNGAFGDALKAKSGYEESVTYSKTATEKLLSEYVTYDSSLKKGKEVAYSVSEESAEKGFAVSSDGETLTIPAAYQSELGPVTIIVTDPGNENYNTATSSVKLSFAPSYKGVDFSEVEAVFQVSGEPVSSVTYEPGHDWTPDFVGLKLFGKLLNEGLYTKPSWTGSFENAGSYEAQATAEPTAGFVNPTATVAFTIEPKNINELKWGAITIAPKVYTGASVEIAQSDISTLSYAGKNLELGEDILIGYKNNVNVGTATAIVSGDGNYTAEKELNFQITSADISKTCTVEPIGTQICVSQNADLRPALTITNNASGVQLVPGDDYIAIYSNNSAVGTASVKILGQGSYTGSIKTSFLIRQTTKDLSDYTISDIDPQEYTGGAITPPFSVKGESKVLVAGTDYTFSYSNNVNRGTATVIVRGAGEYSGTLTKTFQIYGNVIANLENADITVENAPYTGEAVVPEVRVTFKDGTTLLQGKEFEVSVPDNAVEIGEYKATIKGITDDKGNEVSGVVEKSFKVVKNKMSDCIVTGLDSSVKYTGAAITQDNLKVYSKTGTELNKSDYLVTYSNNDLVGIATVTITSASRNYTGSLKKTFTIEPTTFEDTPITIEGNGKTFTYTGEDIPIVVKTDKATLKEGKDYTVMYVPGTDDLKNVGVKKVVIEGVGAFDDSTEIAEFAIEQASIADAAVTLNKPSVTYNGKEQSSEVKSVSLKLNGKNVALSANDYEVANVKETNAGSYEVKVTGKGNFTGTATGTFTIAPVDFKTTKPTIKLTKTSASFTNKKQTSDVKSVTLKLNGADVTLTKDVDYTSGTVSGTKAGKYPVTVTGINNFTGTATVNFTINQIANPTTVTSKAKTKAKALKIKVGKNAVGATLAKNQGTLVVANKSSNATAKKLKLAIAKNKKNITVTVPKGTKKGIYEVKVQVTAKAAGNYKALNKTVSVWVKVS